MAETSKIQFGVLGGGSEVGANCYQLAINGHLVVLDCGTHPKKEGREALPDLSYLRRAPDSIILSHGHQDHCGAMPYLVREFPYLQTHVTIPTARLMERMLHNSVSVMGIISRERGIRDYPLYLHEDVNYAMRGVHAYEFEEPFTLSKQSPVEVTFHCAGHVLGSASTLIKAPGHTIFYTGDICETDQELMRGYAAIPEDTVVDTLITESTNGAMEESRVRDYREEILALSEAIAEVLRNGGTVLLPSFALGRTQEVLNIVARLQEEGRVPAVPVYASGLGRAVYEIYQRFEEYLMPNAELRPLDQFDGFGNAWEPGVVEALLRQSCIIVATSGMMLPNTPSSLIAQQMVKETRHGIFFVGYLDHETLGYELLLAKPGDALQFQLGEPKVEVRLENIRRFQLSAHAPRAAIRTLIDRLRPKNIVYVHGDPEAIAWMKENTGNGANCFAPVLGETVTIEA